MKNQQIELKSYTCIRRGRRKEIKNKEIIKLLNIIISYIKLIQYYVTSKLLYFEIFLELV